MKTLAVILIVVASLRFAKGAEEKPVTLNPFEVERSIGLESRIARAAREWKAVRPEKKDGVDFGFFVAVESLSPKASFCIYGSLQKGGPDRKDGMPDLKTGTLVLKRPEGSALTEQRLELSPGQVSEVYDWFQQSSFLNPKEPETVPAGGYDGDDMLIEVIQGDRTFRFHRNNSDNTNAEKFYLRIWALLVWAQKA